MAKKLKVTKPDGHIHHTPIGNKAFYEGWNRMVPANHQYLLEEVDESDIDHSKWKDEDLAQLSVERTKDLTSKLKESEASLKESEASLKESEASHADKDKKLAELERKLAAATGPQEKAADVITKIGTVTTVDDLNDAAGSDTRPSVVAAYNKKLAELEKAAENPQV